MTRRKKKAGGGNPPAPVMRQQLSYQRPISPSRRRLLEQAGEILLALRLPLEQLERVALTYMFEKRLRRVYEGVAR